MFHGNNFNLPLPPIHTYILILQITYISILLSCFLEFSLHLSVFLSLFSYCFIIFHHSLMSPVPSPLKTLSLSLKYTHLYYPLYKKNAFTLCYSVWLLCFPSFIFLALHLSPTHVPLTWWPPSLPPVSDQFPMDITTTFDIDT